MAGLNGHLYSGEVVRKAVVAGRFYQADPVELKKEIDSYIEENKKSASGSRILICPHAGYIFSGSVAASAYSTVNKNIRRVILLGPSHYFYIDGIGIGTENYYQTPLGKIEVDKDITDKLLESPGVHALQNLYNDREHCLEVQLPFLQTVLDDGFRIVPIITGNMESSKIAELIFPYIDNSTIVIVSSDLSHYKSQNEARKIDDRTVEAILAGNINGQIEACGELAIKTAMYLAKKMNLSAELLDTRTSYETAPSECSKIRVVGYASIVFHSKSSKNVSVKPEKNTDSNKEQDSFSSPHIQKFLLELARSSLEASVNWKKTIIPKDLPKIVKENSGCFVTLTINEKLRGCIGYIEPIKPLYMAVIDNACNAALNDPRFPSVKSDELDQIRVEISVLTKPEVLKYSDPDDLLNKLIPEKHGVILEKGPYESTFLPQVWESIPDKVMFLRELSLKGGMDSDGWKSAVVKTYQAIHFIEP